MFQLATALYSDNPAFLEVRKYISPEFHTKVLALIEELGLEVVLS